MTLWKGSGFMRQAPVVTINEGSRLGEPIFEPDGTLLLAHGVGLTRFHLDALKQRGITEVYIEDEQTAGISRSRPIKLKTRNQIARTLRDSFDSIGDRLAPLREAALEQAEAYETGAPVSAGFRRDLRQVVDAGHLRPIVSDVDALLADLDGNSLYSGLESLRDHDSYTFQHSVDVTVLGLMLAKKAGWQGSRLRAFGVGLILHDIGKLFVEPHVLTKPGKLEAAEFDSIKRHPALGHTVIRELMPHLGPLPGVVALQHHERQDGTGYPRGIKGANRLDGTNQPGMIHDFGALSAVADVYDALASDRPYRKGFGAEEVVRLIVNLSGTHLNREAVEIFRTVVTPYPACSQVRVCNGRWENCTGVVCRDNPASPDRPTVRLLIDANGRDMNPVDLDLSTAATIQISSNLGESLRSAAA